MRKAMPRITESADESQRRMKSEPDHKKRQRLHALYLAASGQARHCQVIAALLSEHVRENDLAARLAGDEFVLLLRRTGLARATEVCDRVRRAVAGYDWSAISAGLSVTVSVGVAQSEPRDTLQTLMHRSDVAMYAHKALKSPVA